MRIFNLLVANITIILLLNVMTSVVGIHTPCVEGCVNGDCTYHGNCSCWSSYEKNPTNPYVCDLVCSPPCGKGGKCVMGTRGRKCLCNEGYHLENGVCKINEAHCDLPCVNGLCLKPNSCMCLDEHRFKNGSSTECEPIPCRHGTYNNQANECVCDKNYYLNERTNECELICISSYQCKCMVNNKYTDESVYECGPTCNPSCEYGECIAPDQCKCLYGRQLKNGSSHECELVCSPRCGRNAECGPYGYCKCREGYSREYYETQHCEPICDPYCQHANCVAPGVCTCYEGYKPRGDGSMNICDPVCDPPCENGKCITPNNCNCYRGYEFKSGSQNVCEESCDLVCTNGRCVVQDSEKDICECNDGYEQDEDETECIKKRD